MTKLNIDVLAIIPARGGSKGIPRKNLQPLAGKPLLAHTIEAAQGARYVGRVIVSTEDAEIAAVSEKYGADVIWRPEDISGDKAPSESALLHALEHLHEIEGYSPDIVVFLQCTSPLTLPEDIDGTIKTLLDENADSALAVTPFHYFLWTKNKKWDAVGINHNKKERLMRQEAEPQFLETGAVYVMRTKGFKKAKHRFFGKTAMYIMPPERCLEIDEPIDLKIAEVLMREREQEHKLRALPSAISALVLDFDGVFTDNRVIVFEDGKEAVLCNRSDGMGLSQLKKSGLRILVLSTEDNPVVQARCDKLSIEYIQGVQDKLEALRNWLKTKEIDASTVAYVGNDVNDIECMQEVGCGVAVSDAHPHVKANAHIILSASGGQGAIREIAVLIEQKLAGEKNVKCN
jgi:N-acylneuraminate cytidylyltransferase